VAVQHFLTVFNHTTDELVEFEPFGRDGERATSEYAAAERKYRDYEDYEIVLVGADSRETLEVTHSRYFRPGEVVPF